MNGKVSEGKEERTGKREEHMLILSLGVNNELGESEGRRWERKSERRKGERTGKVRGKAREERGVGMRQRDKSRHASGLGALLGAGVRGVPEEDRVGATLT